MISQEYTGSNLVFIVGCPRSGTTLLRQLLASHPKVHSGVESRLFAGYIGSQLRSAKRDFRRDPGSPNDKPPTGLSNYLSETEFRVILRDYMLKLIEPMVGNLAPDEIFVEKTPEHSLFIHEIIEMLPQCRIVHILRDGRDVVSSLLAASRSWGSRWAPKSSRGAARFWVNHVETVRRLSEDIPSVQFYELRYEDLTRQTEQVLRDISKFLRIDWDDGVLANAVEKSKAQARNASGKPDRFIRKGKPGSWKKDLSFSDKLLVWLVARKTMRKAGYEWKYPW